MSTQLEVNDSDRRAAAARQVMLAGLPITERRLQPAGVSTAGRSSTSIGPAGRTRSGLRQQRIEVPTSLLWGRHDRFVPLHLAEAASTRLGWPLQAIDAGHVPHIERSDAFLRALQTVLGGSRPAETRSM